MNPVCTTCPFLEYHFAFDRSRPFCCALKSGREVPEQTVQFTCSTGRYRVCKHYDAQVIDVAAVAPSFQRVLNQ